MYTTLFLPSSSNFVSYLLQRVGRRNLLDYYQVLAFKGFSSQQVDHIDFDKFQEIMRSLPF